MPNIKYRLSLTPEERGELNAIVKKGRHSSRKGNISITPCIHVLVSGLRPTFPLSKSGR